jgi:TPR repeat protein
LYEKGLAQVLGLNFQKKDIPGGQLMIVESAAAGFPMAVAHCHKYGLKYGLRRRFETAFKMLVTIEKQTHYHWSQYLLGVCYDNGDGTKKNYTKAVEWYSKSSEQKNPVAMNNLGDCYSNGQGCDQNEKKGFEWYEKSANLGCSAAMTNVGMCYQFASGVTKDLNKATEWYTQAIGQRAVKAQQELDNMNRFNTVSFSVEINQNTQRVTVFKHTLQTGSTITTTLNSDHESFDIRIHELFGSSVGSKRGRLSSLSSLRTTKRQKKDQSTVTEHSDQWLFEEGRASWYGSDFKEKDKKRGRLMIEASASAGFPMAVAYCHYQGWNGLKQDYKKAFDEFVKIEKDTNGYHDAQFMIGVCYQYGHGTEKDIIRAAEWYAKSTGKETVAPWSI